MLVWTSLGHLLIFTICAARSACLAYVRRCHFGQRGELAGGCRGEGQAEEADAVRRGVCSCRDGARVYADCGQRVEERRRGVGRFAPAVDVVDAGGPRAWRRGRSRRCRRRVRQEWASGSRHSFHAVAGLWPWRAVRAKARQAPRYHSAPGFLRGPSAGPSRKLPGGGVVRSCVCGCRGGRWSLCGRPPGDKSGGGRPSTART